MPRRRNERKPPVTRLQICRICGEAFETVEEDRDRCHDCRPNRHGVGHEPPKQSREDEDA